MMNVDLLFVVPPDNSMVNVDLRHVHFEVFSGRRARQEFVAYHLIACGFALAPIYCPSLVFPVFGFKHLVLHLRRACPGNCGSNMCSYVVNSFGLLDRLFYRSLAILTFEFCSPPRSP